MFQQARGFLTDAPSPNTYDLARFASPAPSATLYSSPSARLAHGQREPSYLLLSRGLTNVGLAEYSHCNTPARVRYRHY